MLQALARVPDPRDAGGQIHPLPGLLAIAIAAVVSGSSRVVEIVEWAADLPDAAWDRLGATRDAFTVARRVPDDSTLARVLTGIDAGALDAAVCRWLLSRAVLTGAGRRVIAVDGKTLRGSGPTGAQVHLLAALDQAEQIGLAQINVAQQPREQISGNSRGDGASWQVTADEMIADVVAEYTEACTESRRIAARFALDDTVPHHRLGWVSLCWIYVHMIEEMPRHAGHADILREQIDAATGD
ncbi:mycothiol transferase [Micromonospora zamorensis]|uniref:mycothiol transferase n=1 Tax=Micromonospora zamorensis TaxID=709883 RepID=UPI003796E44B